MDEGINIAPVRRVRRLLDMPFNPALRISTGNSNEERVRERLLCAES
jgi:hypothetical protein